MIKYLILVLFVFTISSVFTVSSVYGDVAYDCVITVQTEIISIYYDESKRANSDGTFYPGDGFDYLFKYSGSDICTSFSVQSISSSGAIYLPSHDILNGFNLSQNHPHDNYEIITKYLTVKHYYIDTVSYPKCDTGICITVTESEDPSYSVREDQTPSTSLQRLLDSLGTASTYSIRIEETQEWGLVEEITDHTHETDRHPLEDDSSSISFDELVSIQCSNLQINQGCVYGHAEINHTVVDEICLIEELEKLGIDTANIPDECIDNPNDLSLIVSGNKNVWGTTPTGEPILELVTVTSTASTVPVLLDPAFDIKFQFPALLDLDALDAMNHDGTYYVDDPAAVIRYTDFKHAEERWPLITFSEEYTITNPSQINNKFTHDCNDVTCVINATYPQIYDNEISYSNGWGIDVWDIDDILHLGKYSIQYTMTVFNVDEELYTDTSNTDLLFVTYDPLISAINTWPRLGDAGHTSVDSRYAISIQYDGSFGGGPDDDADSDTIHPQRRMKITDVYDVPVMSNGFNMITTWSPTVIISQIDNINDMKISESVMDTIPDWFEFSQTNYTGSLVVSTLTNNTAMVFYEAGFARFLQENDIPEEPLDRNYSDIQMHDTLMSNNFAGLESLVLAYSEYSFPYGFFSIAFNVTSYKFLLDDDDDVSNSISCEEGYLCESINSVNATIDDKVLIHTIDINDKGTINDNIFSISTTEFFLNNHYNNNVTEPFSYMLLSDLFEMNPVVYLSEYGTSEILMNKTSMNFNLNLYNEFANDKIFNTNKTFAEIFNITSSVNYNDILSQEPMLFFSGTSSYDVLITAQRNDDVITNTIHYENIPFKYPISYKMNMYPDNYLMATRGTNIIVFDDNPYFGDEYDVYLNGTLLSTEKNNPNSFTNSFDILCNEMCMITVPDASPVEITLKNIWGGEASGIVEALIIPDYDVNSLIELFPMRLLYIVSALGVMYFAYIILKKWYTSLRPGKSK